MRSWFWMVLVSVLPAAALAMEGTDIPGVTLRGEWVQGGVLVGRAPVGARVWFNARELRLDADGRFVFGLHRDEPPTAELRVQLPDEPASLSYRTQVKARRYDIQRIDGLPPKMVAPPPEVQARIAADQAAVARARDRDSPLAGFAESFIWPCIGPVSGVFGSQRILNGEPKQPHYGVDVAVPTGTKVFAPASGIVSLAHPDMYYTGGTLMIDHGHGLSSAFLHLSKLLVKEGQAVRQGEPIALSGATGRATGAHLDWRVNWFDARVDAQMLVPPMDQARARNAAR
ncbi:M23 family metallopeptidase [Fontimonas sp. SYSU GA230001]|uniref:M23 family metallopeptidase n=1 Tax=Fontimonas sp. SYSU GA230001 TaxID=3142450 RepID=UPI0032B5C96B